MKYDIAEIKLMADCRDVAKHLGISLNRQNRSLASWRGGDGFNVYYSKDYFVDFAHDDKGDVFEMVQTIKNYSFTEACTFLADYYNIKPVDSMFEAVQPKPEIDKEYIYTDESRKPIHKTIRYIPKDFKQFDIVNNQFGLTALKELYPYNLPEVIKSDFIVINEGEKAAEACITIGLVGTCIAGGKNGWEQYYLKWFKNKKVFIIQDNDPPDKQNERPGEKFALSVANALYGIAAEIKIAIVSNQIKGDICEFISEGGTKEAVLQLYKDTPKYKPVIKKCDKRSETSADNGRKGGRPFVPVQKIADEFVKDRYTDDKNNIHLKHYNLGYYVYNSRYYIERTNDEIIKEITGYTRTKYLEDFRIGGSIIKDIELNIKATDLTGLTDVKKIPFWINSRKPASNTIICNNGILDINKCLKHLNNECNLDYSILDKHTSNLFSLFGVDYDFIPEADCSKWLRYLEDVQPDESNRKLLQMMFGLSLIPETKYNVAFLLYGNGGTGKSVCLYVLHHFVGNNNVCCVPLSHFGNKFSLHPLTTKLLNIVGELPTSCEHIRMADIEGILKDITDGGLLPIEKKNCDPQTARAIARCIFAGNELPHFSDKTDGIWDRLRIIPFNVKVRKTSFENPNLKYEIVQEELPGVLCWSLIGLSNLLDLSRFPESKEGERILAKHRAECDHERSFLMEAYIEEPDAKITSIGIYTAYKEWMHRNGYRGILGHSNFNKSVERVFRTAELKENMQFPLKRMNGWKNLRIKTDKDKESES